MGKKENEFQGKLIKEIKERFPGSMVLKNDPNYIQGIPDLLVLYEGNWAALECKKSKKDMEVNCQPNQPYYISTMNQMSFASFIYPENKEEVLDELERSFKVVRETCDTESEQ